MTNCSSVVFVNIATFEQFVCFDFCLLRWIGQVSLVASHGDFGHGDNPVARNSAVFA